MANFFANPLLAQAWGIAAMGIIRGTTTGHNQISG
jgi:hypothetical protein